MATIVIKCTSGNVRGQAKVEAVEPGIVTFHIYHDGRIEKHIPKFIKAGYEKKYRYVYHGIDANGVPVEIEIQTLDFILAKKKQKGLKLYAQPQRDDILEDSAIQEGQTTRRIVYQNGDIAEYGSNQQKYFWRLYKAMEEDIELVRMPDSLSIKQNDICIQYNFSNTQRRYTGPDVFAGFIGALATTGLKLTTTGSCFKYGSCFPSSEHINGNSIDTMYLTREKEQSFISAMNKFGFYKQITGSGFPPYEDAIREKPTSTLHNSHLHSEFLRSWVKTIALSIFWLLLLSISACSHRSFIPLRHRYLGANPVFWEEIILNNKKAVPYDSVNPRFMESLYSYFRRINSPITFKFSDSLSAQLNCFRTKGEGKEEIKVYLYTIKKQNLIDSLLCYHYINDADNLSAKEQLYYIDTIQGYVETIVIYPDVETMEVDDYQRYQVLPNGRLKKDKTKS